MFDVGEIVEQKYIVVQLYYIEKYIEESSCFMQLFQQSNLLHYFLMFAIWPKHREYVWASDGGKAILADQ